MLISAFFLTTVLLACDTDRAQESAGASREKYASIQNCLFIVLDAARAGNTSLAGYGRTTTPFMDTFAEDAVYFEAAYSQATSTSPSAWSYLTGRYPYWPESGSVFLVKKTDHLLPAAFKKAGFRTGGFSENPYIREPYGFDQGFDRFEYIPYFHTKPASYKYADLFDPRPSKRVVDEAKNWLRSVEGGPWFCYVHLLRPHAPYTASAGFAGRFVAGAVAGEEGVERMREREAGIMDRYLEQHPPTEEERQFLVDLYDGNLAYGDSLVREIVLYLEERGQLDSTLVIVASDHGEAFLEHGQLLHTSTPYEELLHVPLLIRAPADAAFRAGRVSESIELLDLFPTLVDIFGLSGTEALDGVSLLPLLRGEDTYRKDVLFAENYRTRSVTVRRGTLKLFGELDETLRGFVQHELFDLERDPLEKVNVFNTRKEAGELVAMLTAYVESRSTGESFSLSDLTQEEQEEFRALGYIE